jgi:hypothetical protein
VRHLPIFQTGRLGLLDVELAPVLVNREDAGAALPVGAVRRDKQIC